MLHPLDAAERKVREGDMVTAWNDLAEVDFRAVITDRIARERLLFLAFTAVLRQAPPFYLML